METFKGFSMVFPAPWLAKVQSSQKSNGCDFSDIFSRHNKGRDKLNNKFWREKCSENHIQKPLRWF